MKILRELKRNGIEIGYKPKQRLYWFHEPIKDLWLCMIKEDLDETYMGYKEYTHEEKCSWHPDNYDFEVYEEFGEHPQCSCFYVWKQCDEMIIDDTINGILKAFTVEAEQ